MRLTPRKTEVEAVVELLESDAYDSASALAKDVIKRVADEFEKREWFAFGWKEGDITLLWGPIPSDNEVTQFGKRVALSGQVASFKLNSTAALLDRLAESDSHSTHCSTCGHPHGAHRHERRLGQCQVECCGCTTDTK